jgi:hypothetical protein
VPVIFVVLMLLCSFNLAPAQDKSEGQGKSNKEQKKLEKEAKKLAKTSEKAGKGLGRDAVFCVLAAHTTIDGLDTAQELKTKFESLTDFPFGQFVAAVLLVDRLDKAGFGLDEVIAKLEAGMSIGQITKEAGVNLGDVRRGFGEIRRELAHSITNPPTRNCFQPAP